MHPADAIRAFATLAAEGSNEAAIAHRFGYDPREVRRMLALASVSPKVINALAADRIDLDTAQAFTLTDDHTRQERVLRRTSSAWEVRRQLTETKATTDHRLYRFVGAQRYHDAGGTVTRDLFAAEGEGYADNPSLLEELAVAKLEEAAAHHRGEGWAEVLACGTTPANSYQWHRLYHDQEGDYSAEARAHGKLLLTIGHDGTLVANAYHVKAPRAKGGQAPALPRPLYDARTTEELSRVRTAALQHEVSMNPRVAMAVLLDALLPMVAGEYHAASGVVQLRSSGTARPACETVNARVIPSPLAVVEPTLSAMPEEPDARFNWLLTLDEIAVQTLLAACTSSLLDATSGQDGNVARARAADQIARAVGLDMHQHWQGGIEFYDRLTRKTLLAVLTEARSSAVAENCAKLKKPDLAAACLQRIDGTGWLPPALRTPDNAAPEGQSDEEGEVEFEAIAA